MNYVNVRKGIIEMIREVREVGFMGFREEIIKQQEGVLDDSPNKKGDSNDALPSPPKVKGRTEVIQTFKPLFLEGKDKTFGFSAATFFSRFRKQAKVQSEESSPSSTRRKKKTEPVNTYLGPFSQPDDKNEWIGIRLDVPHDFRYKKVHQQQYLIYMIRGFGGSKNIAALDYDLFVAAVKLLEGALNILWAKEMRKQHRRNLVKEIDDILIFCNTIFSNLANRSLHSRRGIH